MKIKKELLYREFVQRENNILRAPYNPELEFYDAVKSGDTEKINLLCQNRFIDKEGLGILSKNSLQNMKYHFAITAAIVARYCIEGGMDLAHAYSLSDFYIQKADVAKSFEEIGQLHPIMCMDYTKRMKNLRKQKVCSKPIADCIDYIYDHLHTRITLTELADYVSLNPTYLSRLFKKETGTTVSEYIQLQKINTAKNMLIYSDYSLSEISSTLAFPSQSYFTEVFHKLTSMTPMHYRTEYFRRTGLDHANHTNL